MLRALLADFCTAVSAVGARLGRHCIGRGRDECRRRVHTLVVFFDVAQVVSAAVVSFAHAHRVVCEVDIAVIALKSQSYSSLEGGYTYRRVTTGQCEA